MSSTPTFEADDHWSPVPTEEERAFAEALFAAERAAVEASGFVPQEWDEVPVGAPEFVPLTDAELLGSGSSVPAAADLLLLDSIDPAGLGDPRAVLRYLEIAGRLVGFTEALATRARVALAGAQSSGELMSEMHIEHELAVATKTSRQVAGLSIERARTLTTVFPQFLEALAQGRVNEAHCRILVTGTRSVVDPDALTRIGDRLLPKARRMAPGPFKGEVAKAVAEHDPDAAARHERAREQRSVWTREIEDGMSFLGLVHDTPTIAAMKATLDADAAALTAERGGRTALLAGEEDAAAGACRADALAARVLGTVDETGAIDWTPKPADVQVQLVIDLDTLRGEVDRHCLLDGQPVPATIGRDLAGYATAWRRMVTDPVTGHLLDYGRLTYLPAPLRTYVLARDGGCRAPGCHSEKPSKCEMDHAVEYPHGPSTPANTGGKCRPTHQLKTAGYAHIENSQADGSCDWVTAWGQRVHIPARPFLHDPTDHPPEPPPPEPCDPPPF
ncbi:MAG: DUF222 domain-containing protein [Candidatus Nanopelagicales bacterium]